MIIKLFLAAIILYIIIKQFCDSNNQNDQLNDKQNNIYQDSSIIIKEEKQIKQNTILQHDVNDEIEEPEEIEIPVQEKKPKYKIQEFDRPYPWTKVIYVEGEEFPYLFHIKLTIPSLNDYERWKQIVPNIEFNPNTREIIIPSKDEASALALANLMSINFSGQMTMKEILDKDLIKISITKAKSHEVVKNKLREQIMEVLYGKSFSKVQTNYEQDLAKNGITSNGKSTNAIPSKNNSSSNRNETITLKSEGFRDTFQHFSDGTNNSNNNDIGAYDNNSYSYI